MKEKVLLIISWVIAIIYLQTLYFKFSGHPDSIHIFSTLGLEPYGRIIIGFFELIAAVLLLVPKTRIYAAMLSLVIITGAIFSHLGPLGIEVNGDGGKVFYLAVVVFVLSLVYLVLKKDELINFIKK
ncbi:hypothetical protein UJ101_01639 [Flavobacteriaceae bacterium UJ101]|nr:hypothetical protein UJ101_01639 [Flavobacteriaceae bacterium UJ101]